MTNTTQTYMAIENNLSRYKAMTAAQPAVKTATDYYTANIGKVKTIQALVGNYRLLSYALQAYGLGDQINNKALITKVLQGGTSSSTALANTLPNPNWAKFAKAFDFIDKTATAPSAKSAITTTTANYVEQQLETQQGQSDPGVQLALYFKRVAPTVSNGYSILGDENLLEKGQTIFGLAPTTNSSEIDAEAAAVEKLVPTSSLTNSKTLESLVERFTANYDANYGPSSNGQATPLTVNSGNAPTTTSAPSTILSGIISSNGSTLSGLLSGTSTWSFGSVLSALALGG